MSPIEILEQAAQKAFSSADRPAAAAVRAACLEAEKNGKRSKEKYAFAQLVGDWRLCFITGTKKTQKKSGSSHGSRSISAEAGLYFSFLCTQRAAAGKFGRDSLRRGQLQTTSSLQGFTYRSRARRSSYRLRTLWLLTFTRMVVRVYGVKLFDGFIRKGEAK